MKEKLGCVVIIAVVAGIFLFTGYMGKVTNGWFWSIIFFSVLAVFIWKDTSKKG